MCCFWYFEETISRRAQHSSALASCDSYQRHPYVFYRDILYCLAALVYLHCRRCPHSKHWGTICLRETMCERNCLNVVFKSLSIQKEKLMQCYSWSRMLRISSSSVQYLLFWDFNALPVVTIPVTFWSCVEQCLCYFGWTTLGWHSQTDLQYSRVLIIILHWYTGNKIRMFLHV